MKRGRESLSALRDRSLSTRITPVSENYSIPVKGISTILLSSKHARFSSSLAFLKKSSLLSLKQRDANTVKLDAVLSIAISLESSSPTALSSSLVSSPLLCVHRRDTVKTVCAYVKSRSNYRLNLEERERSFVINVYREGRGWSAWR